MLNKIRKRSIIDIREVINILTTLSSIIFISYMLSLQHEGDIGILHVILILIMTVLFMISLGLTIALRILEGRQRNDNHK